LHKESYIKTKTFNYDPNLLYMTWKEYENEICHYFRIQFPKADISLNVFIEGRYSKTQRQIDILIEEYVAGNRIRIIVDGKYFIKSIDVKNVEMFIGMLNDCGANKGLLITQKGYSKAAINRAYYDQLDLELDILNFKDLLKSQHFLAIIKCGEDGVIFHSPFGWIIDNVKTNDALVTSYQRGLSFKQAQKSNEWIEVRIKSKENEINSLEDYLKLQEAKLKSDSPGIKINYLNTIRRNDASTTLREYKRNILIKEISGFVEFGEFIFECVLITPEELRNKNVRKLESIMKGVINLNSIVKSLDWDIERGKRGSLIFLDIPYLNNKQKEKEYLTLAVAKDYLIDRPEYISVIVPNNFDFDSGILISFGKTVTDANNHYKIDIDNANPIKINFVSKTDKDFTARIIKAYVVLPEKEEKIDIFQKFLDFDHVFFNLFYSDGSHKSIAVPLFSFKTKFKELE
jgi:hypothetical protein